jgi:putative addiction module killer protein
MEIKPQRVEIYEAADDKSPFKSWLRNLRDQRAKQAVRARIARVRLGNLGDHRPVGEGVIELRIHSGPGYRVYLGRDGDELVILLVGGDKSTQDRDITNAKAYWKDHQETKNANQ